MNEKYIEEKFSQHKEKLEEHDRRISDLEKTYIIMQKMDLKVGNIEKNIATINSKLDDEEKSKGKKWDKLVDYLFYAIIAVLLGYIVTKLGLK